MCAPFIGGSNVLISQHPQRLRVIMAHPVTQNVGSAPIGGGLFILLGVGAAYGGKKIYDLRKEMKNEE